MSLNDPASVVHPRRIYLIIMTCLILCAQASLTLGDPVFAIILLVILVFFTVMRKPEIIISRDNWCGWDLVAMGVFYLVTLGFRFYLIDKFHNIDGLSARFGYTVNEILKGNYIFPCMSRYEFDETLSAFIAAPFIQLTGKSWTSYKMVSAGLASLIIPASYFTAFRIAGRTSAVMAAGLLSISGYMQRCDPLISMLRFNIVALLVVLNIYFLIRFHQSRGKWIWAVAMGVFAAVPLYIHSLGRILPVMVFFALILILKRLEPDSRRKAIPGVLITGVLMLIISVPIIKYIFLNGGYLYYKKRQILGFHEKFPFSMHALMNNIFITLTNFNYRAQLQTFFPGDRPLLRFMTATGVLGGLIFLWYRRRHIEYMIFMIGIMTCVLPLCIVTPGYWRGVYFTPSVVILTILSGVYWGELMRSLTGKKTSANLIAVFLLLGFLALIRVPGFYQGRLAPPLASNQITRLYVDLESTPDFPHYFSADLDQCVPGTAIYEFTKTTLVENRGIFKVNPLRILRGNGSYEEVSPGALGQGPLIFILAPGSEEETREEIAGHYKNITEYRLPASKLLTLRINFPE